MIERIIVVIGVSLLLVVIMATLKRHQLSCAQSSATLSSSNSTPKPQLLYFWSNKCCQCTSVQTPIIEELSIKIGEEKLTVHKTNISDSLEQATRWGVKTVPTTYVLDENGIVRHVNNGLATKKLLVKQIEGL